MEELFEFSFVPMKILLIYLSSLFIIFPIRLFGQAEFPMLLPKPQIITFHSDHFFIGSIRLETPVLERECEMLLKEVGGVLDAQAVPVIEIRLISHLEKVKNNPEEAYRISVTSQKILLEALTETGVFRALQTLRQLKSPKGPYFYGCLVTDWPAFRIRGFMHDTGRSYLSFSELKREIAQLSRYKINTFHWHLTENQAWRIESKIFPQLNDSVNMSRLPGQYYTQEEARELVRFCKQHHILLIPEIDMPGHSEAFVRTFGCDMQSPQGMMILKQLLDEICTVFDVPYLHIGTDEVRFTHPDFVPEMVNYVRSKGKKVISWNPGWPYQKGEIDMTQLWSYRGKAQTGIPAIDSRFHYLNHYDVFGDLVALYNSRIYNCETGNEDIAGVILAVWNDRLVVSEKNILLENNFYPCLLAIAERAWLGGGSEYFDQNGPLLPTEDDSVSCAFADFEKRLLWHKEHYFQHYPFPYVRQTQVKWNITDAFPNAGNLEASFPPEKKLRQTYFYQNQSYSVRTARGAGIYLRHVWGDLIPGFMKEPRENHTAYAWTWVYSPRKQETGLWVEFQNYGRSEKDLPPPQGKWDYRGSRIWLNGTELLPPRWTNTHTSPSTEIALGNENCTARPPLLVHLKKGWNKLFLKLPIGKFSTPEIRLQKWMFTVIFVNPDGQKATENLTYSPHKIKPKNKRQ